MSSVIIAGLKRALIGLAGSVMTEALYTKVLSRLTVSLLERIAKSTKTTVDDVAIAPVVAKLREQF